MLIILAAAGEFATETVAVVKARIDLIFSRTIDPNVLGQPFSSMPAFQIRMRYLTELEILPTDSMEDVYEKFLRKQVQKMEHLQKLNVVPIGRSDLSVIQTDLSKLAQTMLEFLGLFEAHHRIRPFIKQPIASSTLPYKISANSELVRRKDHPEPFKAPDLKRHFYHDSFPSRRILKASYGMPQRACILHSVRKSFLSPLWRILTKTI